ncbi:CLUMA_CG014729, isoform A [Clunio marinus]|uniref:CLUMA_CG014729, isoform A n=1 Tax=Clunio marinus TaxID=568069 RepID=A0A1J1ILG4_9DIPT|nr:CLUMA_CG014729, isoform A [Clunio marinus]
MNEKERKNPHDVYTKPNKVSQAPIPVSAYAHVVLRATLYRIMGTSLQTCVLYHLFDIINSLPRDFDIDPKKGLPTKEATTAKKNQSKEFQTAYEFIFYVKFSRHLAL